MTFTVYCHPEPQGSSKAFVVGGKARITSDNAKLKPYRHIVTATMQSYLINQKLDMPLIPKHEPVCLSLLFTFNKPISVKKKRTSPVVKPDLDKLIRATFDALTGVLFHDDAQVVSISAGKAYGAVEGVEIGVEE